MDLGAERRLADAALGLRHVFVRGLTLAASIGVHRHEHEGRQPVRIGIELAVEDDGARPMSRPAVGRDELSRVVDYERIAALVRAIVAQGHVQLVETLAERIAEACLSDHRVRIVRVTVEKPEALPDADCAGVTIERRRG
ncbi:dihydroneopterin aldolase [Elioraea sp. Yellowstone]|jgi:dihydroneopterin aldolase|uniref:dihydroneopterin aldolase n=1 Tax=Elioraea sp. Yellowstone TaxID=2592070 RepID=UPI00114DEE32|nr:dihydroneopterin aldolase [Elioraea sp. Yellowstone]TQF77989.1 dihydroneopterin aldolase [Elioraea sp. Yellowstone]